MEFWSIVMAIANIFAGFCVIAMLVLVIFVPVVMLVDWIFNG